MLRFRGSTSPRPTTDAPLCVFVSYSRKDLNIADRIVAALEQHGIKILIDRRSLPIAVEWQNELADMIRQSDTILWLVSEHSINSDWCQWELATLIKYDKRLVPIQVGPMKPEALPDIIGNLHIANFTDPETFDKQIERLVEAFLVPYDWVKLQTWLADQASRRGNRLRGDDLRKAEQWLLEKPDFAPQPSEAIRDLITTSRRLANRNKNLAIAASVLGMMFAGGAAWYSYEQSRAAQMAESEALALASSQTTDNGDAASALLMGMKGLPGEHDLWKRPILPAPQRSIYKAMFSLREARLFEGHEEALTYAETSNDGHKILTSSSDGTARLWHPDGGSMLTLDHHSGSVNMARFSPNASRIVTASNDGTGILWNREGAKIATLDRHTKPVLFAKFSDDGQYVVTTSEDYTVRLWSAVDGEHIRDFKEYGDIKGHDGFIVAAAFNPDQTLLATASVDKTARIWPIDGTTSPLLLDQHEDRVLWVEFDPTGKLVGTASRDDRAIIWTSQGHLIKVLDGHNGDVNRIRFAPHASLAITASDDNTAKLWNVRTGIELTTLQGHDSRLIDAAFSADGSRILTASVDGAIGLWRLVMDGDDDVRVERIAILRGHERDIVSAKFSADGEWVISASKDHTARLWRATDGQSFAESLRHDQDVRSFAFSAGGKWILTAAKGGLIKIWNATTHELVSEKNLAPIEIISTGFSSDNTLIALAHEDGAVSLYDRASLDKVGRNLIGHEMRVRSVDFSSDDKRLVTSSADKTARVWDLETRQTILRLHGHGDRVRSAVFSPDDQMIVTVSADHTARLWDSHSGGDPIKTFAIHEDEVWAVAFSPDGSKIVTGSEDGQAFITSLDEGGVSRPLIGHDDNIRSAEFSRDGRYVLTSSWDRTVRLWDVETGEEVARVPSEDIILDAAFDPSGKRIAHLVRNQVRFRPIYATLDELIHAVKDIMPRSRTRTERIQNAVEQPVGWFDGWLDLIKDSSKE